ncbi:hypothetical protein [Deinococcus ficus]|uniref:Uncharacterized protein n=1 Tax=Deinococcus ficus TaxID=317577 RepID=A0A221SYG2_9DEIO|nr:hypothetical protein [Deinococcus ficus]ASN81697.1 hypothetical protein DFI_12465 [Deinococcus ficus]
MLEPAAPAGPKKKAHPPKKTAQKKTPTKAAARPAPAVKKAAQKTAPAVKAKQATPTRTVPPVQPKKAAAKTETPKAATGVFGFFSREFKALRNLGSKQLSTIHTSARKFVGDAKAFAKNPVQSLKNAGTGLAAAAAKTLGSARDAVGKKVKQFKDWYATPEGKAKFWKGVAMTGIAIATVATGGALTAPALALAAAVSAGGGIAAQVVENKVYNAAAKAKQQQDKNYKFKERKTFEGVSAKSIAIDAVVGSVGGPAFKFAGKVLVRGSVAVGKAALPFAKGLGHLGVGAARGAARRYLPAGVQTALKAVGSFTSKHAGKITQFAKRAAARGMNAARSLKNGAGKAVTSVKDFVKKGANAAYAKTRFTRKYLMQQTRTLRKFARKVGNAPTQVADAARKKIHRAVVRFRWTDRKMMNVLKAQYEKSPTVRIGRFVRNKVDGLGDKASKSLVNLKVKAADGLDNLAAATKDKLGKTKVMQYLRNYKDGRIKYFEEVVKKNPDGHYAKAILEFRASGKAMRTHLGKVWDDASKDLNKDLSRLLGRHGSVQADFKNLAEKGSRELYEVEVQRARSVMEQRLRTKVMEDVEATELLKAAKQGATLTDAVRQGAKEKARAAADDAVSQSAEKLTRQAETSVARHPTVQLEEHALKVQALESSKKVTEHYFGKGNGQKGLLEKTGLAISTPVRVPITERLEKYTKVVEAVKSATPLQSVALLGTEAVQEQTEKAITKVMEAPVKEWAKKFKGEPEQEKPKEEKKTVKEEDTSEIMKILDSALEGFLPTSMEEYINDVLKQGNIEMKGDE